jgi:proline dehydrogenase
MSLLRSSLLKASKSVWLREHAPRYGFFRRTSQRFLPGENAEDALAAARQLAGNGVGAILTRLGENINDRSEAEAVTQHYLGVLERIRSKGPPAEISVKLTQLGLDFDAELCFANVVKLIEHMPAGKMLWIDMEQGAYADATLELYLRARETSSNVGVCVQAYLYRTEKDVERLIAAGGTVRLVKGAYNEPAEIAFPKKKDVDDNFFHLAQMLVGSSAVQANVRAAIGTHDLGLIARLREWATTQGIAKDRLEFQMLYGIQRAEQVRLAREGYRSSVLINYGSHWFPWFMRRMAERPANVLFLARNIFSR